MYQDNILKKASVPLSLLQRLESCSMYQRSTFPATHSAKRSGHHAISLFTVGNTADGREVPCLSEPGGERWTLTNSASDTVGIL